MKTEFAHEITIEEMEQLHDEKGIAFEINDGEIKGVVLEG